MTPKGNDTVMGLNKGEKVYCKLVPSVEQYKAVILAHEGDDLVIQADAERPIALASGQQLTVSTNEVDYFTEVVSSDADKIHLKCLGADRREFFRIDDVIAVIIRKVQGDIRIKKSKVISEFGLDMSNLRTYTVDVPDETISPVLWKMLVDISAKLGLILDRLTLESEGLMKAEETEVNISAAGVRLKVKEEYLQGDYLEVKMMLPSSPPMGIVVYGQASSVIQLPGGLYDLSIHFMDVEEDVKDEIIQYTLKRQREALRKHRGYKG
jgi:c-di-GMP-binding flagellar brake protein YcgR